MIDLKALAAEFPREVVHWRAQSLTKNGDKAMALAYIDARDVYERLDEVCGPEGWQCRYSHAEGKGGKTVCEIGIKINDEWVWKANGAGDSDIEGEKGALSDALKRAAVCWGIGRYLYDMPSPWVPCKTYERNGKKVWKAWDGDPWNFVKGKTAPQAVKQAANQTPKRTITGKTADEWVSNAISAIESAAELGDLAEIETANKEAFDRLGVKSPEKMDTITKAIGNARSRLSQSPQAAE